MLFKKLELSGFKSFAEKTTLVFEPGVTAIVGPNGSGKCLVGSTELLTADGQRWTIGELVESALRQTATVVTFDDGVSTTENPARLSVLSVNPQTLKLEHRPIAAFVKRTAPDFLLKISTKSGRTVTATPYHPLFTLQDGQLRALRADEVQVGVRIAVPRRLPIADSDRQATVTELLGAFTSDDRMYVPYSSDLRAFILQLAKRHGGLAALADAAGVSVMSLRGIWSRQAINAASLASLVRLAGRSWCDDQPTVRFKSNSTGEVKIPRVMHRAVARFLGYLIAEGRNAPTNQVWFVNEDPAMVEDFCASAREGFGVEARVFSYRGKTKDVIIFSRALGMALHRLYKFPVGSRSSEKQVPDQIMAAPDEVAAEFLSALFEGDGYLADRGSAQYVEYATASEALARDVATLLLRFGVTSLIRQKMKYASNTKARIRRPYYSVYVYGVENLRTLARRLRFVGAKRAALARFGEITRRSNPNLDLVPGMTPLVRQVTRASGMHVKALRAESPKLAAYVERRCEVSRTGIAEVVSLVSRYGTPTTETEAICQHLQRVAESDLYWDEVVAVEQVPPEGPWVYDLSIADTHNFVAANIVVHNSNIADAIKWVLGEQSARELRGGRMEDLIFSGTDARSPLNVAEVTLTFDNTTKRLPTDYAEVAITRRLYRSGESEYLLNKTTVRLKDILELLMGTGIGTSAYSLFEQGKMDQLIHARPEERRVIFEEAAGITKYKTQKREALRKLEQTDANLLRLNDVIGEVRRQLAALERQVKKARVYREQWERLKALEVILAQRETSRLRAEQQTHETALQAIQAEETRWQAQLVEGEQAMAGCRAALERADLAYTQAQAEVLKITHAIEAATRQMQTHQERIEDGRHRSAQAAQEIEALRRQLRQTETQLDELRQAIGTTEPERQGYLAALQEAQAMLTQCEETVRQARAVIQARKSTLVDSAAQTASARNALGTITSQVHGWQARVQRLELEAGRVAQEREGSAAHAAAAEAAVAQAKAREQQRATERHARQAGLEHAQTQTAEAQQRAQDAAQTLVALESRHEMLQGLVASYEGFSAGVKALLDGIRRQTVPGDGVMGILAEAVQVEPGYEQAVEAALGDWAQAIVVETWDAAARCTAYLQGRGQGRATFLVRQAARGTGPLTRDAAEVSWERLIGKVRAEAALQPLIETLLERTYVVPDLPTALELQRTAIVPVRFVTRQGERVTATSVTGGSALTVDSMVVGRQQRLTQLMADTTALREQAQAARRDAEAASAEARALAAALEQADQQSTSEHIVLAEAEAQQASLTATLRKLDDEQALVAAELADGRDQLADLRTQDTAARTALADLERHEAQTHAAIAQAQQQIEAASHEREAWVTAAAQAQASLASVDQVRASREHSAAVLDQSRQGMQDAMAAREQEVAGGTAREQELTQACAGFEQEIAASRQAEAGAAQQVAAAAGQRAEATQAIDREMSALQTVGRDLERVRQRRHERELANAQLTYQQERLTTRLQQVYQLVLEPSTEALPAGRQALPEHDWAAVTQECEGLRGKLEGLGPVSLASIDEAKELDERLTFLTNQQQDLQKGKADLHEAITTISRTTRTQFKETFQKIQQEFQMTFRTLFGGGEARLVLLDEEDLLESGIEIIARPPGKTPQSISLLSGGEKALTSIALLFAVFRIKPSPFCLLDEIDAPLDEANVDRFTRALKEFLKDSQFIIITHNKKTITMADVMYGVTMEEHGVSTLVSVKLHDAATSTNV